MVNITDVKQILQLVIDAEIKVFLDGGWGVDALLGLHTAVSSGSWCGGQRQQCGDSGSGLR